MTSAEVSESGNVSAGNFHLVYLFDNRHLRTCMTKNDFSFAMSPRLFYGKNMCYTMDFLCVHYIELKIC